MIFSKVIKKILPMSVHAQFYCFVKSLIPTCSDKQLLQYLYNTRGDKKFLVVGVPEHSNVGDQAIAAAERQFLKDHFPDIDIVEVPLWTFLFNYRKFKKIKEDCIVLGHGGGNLGTLYWFCEYMVHLILKVFCSQKVTIFPQTVHWEKDNYYTKRIDKYIGLYEQHPDLTVFIRDTSVDFMENVINRNKKINVINTPDMVLYLNKSDEKANRDKILFCLRADKEKVLDEETISQLVSRVQNQYGDVVFTDMAYKTDIPLQCRELVLRNKFAEFRSAKLVVTDRLHGMIFATITGTPCIAFNNSSKKIEGVYSSWLTQIPYIQFVNTVDEAMEKINSLDLDVAYTYDPSILSTHWSTIAQIIRQGIAK